MVKVKWAAGAAMLACTGALAACGSGAGQTPGAGAATGTPSGAATSTASATTTVTPPSTKTPAAPGGTAIPVLSGKREVTIVRVDAFESGLSLDNGELIEADDDSGRQLFVPTPLGGNKYLIKAYGTSNNQPANDEPSCWQVDNPRTTEPLTIQGAVCDTDNPAQRFTITAKGKGTYAISHDSAFLRHSSTRGLILEEPGNAQLPSTFRLVDNGPARRPAGG